VYGSGDSERFIGEALAGRNEPVVVATKFGNDMGGENGDAPRGSREYMRRAVDASLGRLRREHIDLLYYHRPDGVTPLEETLGEMHELVLEGKVRWLGLSNVGTGALDTAAELAARGSSPVVAVQNHFSLLNREDNAVVARAAELGIGYIPYFPLESGLLTGKYRRGQEHPYGARLTGSDRLGDDRIARMEELEAFAESHDHTILELAIGGLASIPGVASVIAGATSPEQARANAAAGAWHLNAAELDELGAV
jgi:aryl-alcohol dehydrogenase-like predicted oxidoreductase